MTELFNVLMSNVLIEEMKGETMPESTQHKAEPGPPAAGPDHYDVEIGGAIQKKELPFVVGVLADLSGKPDGAAAASSRTASSSRSTATTSTRCWRRCSRGWPSRSTTRCQDDGTQAERRAAVSTAWTTSSPSRSSSRSSRCASCWRRAQRLTDLARQDGRQRQARGAAPGRRQQHRVAQEAQQETGRDGADRRRGGLSMSTAEPGAPRPPPPRPTTARRPSRLLDQIIHEGRLARDESSRRPTPAT